MNKIYSRVFFLWEIGVFKIGWNKQIRYVAWMTKLRKVSDKIPKILYNIRHQLRFRLNSESIWLISRNDIQRNGIEKGWCAGPNGIELFRIENEARRWNRKTPEMPETFWNKTYDLMVNSNSNTVVEKVLILPLLGQPLLFIWSMTLSIRFLRIQCHFEPLLYSNGELINLVLIFVYWFFSYRWPIEAGGRL